MSPKVSIITGYYNRSDALDVTIDSIMHQSYQDFELIVFNDCSTDDTKEELAKIEKKYSDNRIVIINHKNNKGFVQGMIDAIKLSRGTYICVQGSGDLSFPERVKKQVELLDSRPNVGVVGCYYENYVETTGVSRKRYKNADGITFEELIKENIYSHGEVMYRRSIYDEVGGYRKEFINCQDYDLWLRMIKVTNFSTVKDLLYRRYIRYDGVSYEPKQFLKQVRYSLVARRLALSDRNVDILKAISHKEIASVVLDEDIQASVIKGVLRSLVWEETQHAENLILIGIRSYFIRTTLLLVSKIYNSKFSSPIRFCVKILLRINV
ncbi:glycosyltransferase family 2 protein [Vibrio lentus]|uniref:Glycosyltransferase 2-like domain-containing protein n=1 Tax=Vibrio lentus TaxID=136468 RepID=A0A2N7IJM1_9VIBR|nr:glycosyltransferase [Vibrio lentus]PML57943.1 hypothetical protein BCT74_18780 [Vibrio lentus]PMM33770.1 hypothetical protein BCT58_26605 [Vibrio lentus]